MTPPPVVPPRLKWHKLRWRSTDPPFQRHNLTAALAAGAPCEVDLRFTADHHAVCLHDPTLEAETTGAGPVDAMLRRDVERLHQRGNNGEVLDTGPLFLDEVVAAAVGKGQLRPGLIQLDVKTPLSGLHPRAIERFGGVVGDMAPAFLASSSQAAVVHRLASAAPGLRSGFDPLALYRSVGRGPGDLGVDELAAVARGCLDAMPAADIYHLEARLILTGLDRGFDLVGYLTADAGRHRIIDAWTVDPDRRDVADVVRRLLDAGVGQITTNDPATLAVMLTAKN